ncbi:type I methionyl aminopeptidase [Lujinxingia vulgaris]|uniref:Methionine aminopeptidase n=1 Tax=Lujinxingia vulgaris TaxID=2600176 RepID=A0A5C6X5P1_9DELT|nr:type I methionyl aminopeptidase [Lujinxingia vulgaris]TXD37209.1 type I methionyl aminopeptidase [Lujinxingia vulgaris]
MAISEADLTKLRRIGSIVAETIQEMADHLKAGMTTGELDAIGRAYLEKHGARSAPELVYNFPGATCISVNHRAAHGIPGDLEIADGDLVNIDVSAELDGFFGDSGASFGVGTITEEQQALLSATEEALEKAMSMARHGRPIQMVGRVVETMARKRGFTVIRNLGGHGIGRSLHEKPSFIPHFYDRSEKRRFKEGMVLTLEPFLAMGAKEVEDSDDGWTLLTENRGLVAQFEHTMVITRDEPIVLTRRAGASKVG